ncbi:MAG: NUDIX domain-containing protein, partial [Actinobacteria bacterium]|nr:NUDIX domain-containing protein [Actinomycetota bacterium]
MSDAIAENLAALLRRHRPADEAERAHQMRTLDWLARAHGPLDRDVFEPGHATGSGFVAGEDGRVGLIFHSKLKLWCQPGGHAEAGETDISAVAARETSEELGVEVSPDQMSMFDIDVHTIAPTPKAPTHLHFDFRFLCVLPAVDLPGGSDAL